MAIRARKERGFTLLEFIIVIIVVGVLASLAIFRLSKMVEFSRSAEALVNFSSIRRCMERCYDLSLPISLDIPHHYDDCSLYHTDLTWTGVYCDNPNNAPGNHFTYDVASIDGFDGIFGSLPGSEFSEFKSTFAAKSGYTSGSHVAFCIVASRNSRDGGNVNDKIYYFQFGDVIGIVGSGAFKGIKRY